MAKRTKRTSVTAQQQVKPFEVAPTLCLELSLACSVQLWLFAHSDLNVKLSEAHSENSKLLGEQNSMSILTTRIVAVEAEASRSKESNSALSAQVLQLSTERSKLVRAR